VFANLEALQVSARFANSLIGCTATYAFAGKKLELLKQRELVYCLHKSFIMDIGARD
jgi:hypothetical protein